MKSLFTTGMVLACALLLATAALAQPEQAVADGAAGGQGGGMPAMGQMPAPPSAMIMRATADGVFLLNGTTLTKYTAGTLQVAGTLTLDAGNAAAGDQAAQPPLNVTATFETVAGDNGTTLLVIEGNTFYNINGTTMTVTVKSTLPAAPAQAAQQGGPGGQGGPMGQGGQGGPMGQGGQGGPMGQGGPGGQGGQQGGPGGQGGPMGQGGPGGQGGAMGQGGPGGQGGMMGMGGPGGQGTQLLIVGSTVYVKRGTQILAVDIASGKVIGQVTVANAAANAVAAP